MGWHIGVLCVVYTALLLNLQGDTDEDVPVGGFHMGLLEKGRSAAGPGFSLKF
jgi:hypothetical protein